MTHQLDTSGDVPQIASDGDLKAVLFADLDAFTQGYVEALFDTDLHPPSSQAWGKPHHLSLYARFADLAPETLARIIADCAARFTGWVLHPNNAAVRGDDTTEGRRFWRDRQSGVATSFPPLTVSLGGKDGKVRLTEREAA